MISSEEDMVEWVEPFGPDDQPAFIRVAKSTAVAYQKHNASIKKYTYETDEDALIDFMVVHWATLVKGNQLAKV